MFAGIVAGTRQITSLTSKSDGLRFEIDLKDLQTGLKVGDSVAVDGVCLTVNEIKKTGVRFHAIQETLRKTTLRALKLGDAVNIERSLRMGDGIDGHFVQGHVFGLGTVTKRIDTASEFKLWIDAGPLAKYIAPVGSIAVNGVSLTVAEVRGNEFAVALIPITLQLTNLGQLQIGDTVNLEPDMIARQIVHFLEHRKISPLA